MNTSNKKEEEQQTFSKKYCKVIAFVTLFLAIALIAYVLFSPSSPVKLAGGERIRRRKMGGGCGCAGTPPPS